MSDPAAFILIREQRARVFFNKWSANGCLSNLVDGPTQAAEVASSDEDEVEDYPFAVAGYLLDFDTQHLIFFGPLYETLEELELIDFDDDESPEAISAFVDAIAPKWEGWTLSVNDENDRELQRHLRSRGIKL